MFTEEYGSGLTFDVYINFNNWFTVSMRVSMLGPWLFVCFRRMFCVPASIQFGLWSSVYTLVCTSRERFGSDDVDNFQVLDDR